VKPLKVGEGGCCGAPSVIEEMGTFEQQKSDANSSRIENIEAPKISHF
jgi:hypothetical protein